MSPTTSSRNVARTRSLMRWTASSPAAMLTPAASYVSPTDGGDLVERRLRGRGADLDRVVAGEAGGAETGAGGAGGRDEPVELEVGQGVGSDVLAPLGQGGLGRGAHRARRGL